MDDKQALLYEKIKQIKLEDKFVEYAKGCQIQENRYMNLLKLEANIAKYTKDLQESLWQSNYTSPLKLTQPISKESQADYQ